MKISVHIEADSAEELQHFFETFQVKQPASPVALAEAVSQTMREHGWVEGSSATRLFVPSEPVKGTAEPVSAPVVPPEPVKAVEKEPEPVVEAPASVEPQKPARGRPAKKAPEAEKPVEVPVAPVLAAAKTVAAVTNGVTRQDLLDVFSEYVQRYGANFGYTDVSKLLQQNLGDGVRKASDVPETALKTAIAAIRSAITENPFNRKVDYAS